MRSLEIEHVQLYGPAFIYVDHYSEDLLGNNYDRGEDLDTLIVAVDPAQVSTFPGAIHLDGAIFRGCSFRDIQLITSSSIKAKFVEHPEGFRDRHATPTPVDTPRPAVTSDHPFHP